MSEQEDSGSIYKVPLTTIREILPHPNAERLEIAVVYGFHVVTGKGLYQPGNPVLYVPVDSILPEDLEKKLFPEGSKVVLNKSRIRQIRLRGYPSQGMLISPTNLKGGTYKLEQNYAEELGITKYEPPTKGPSRSSPNPRNKPLENSRFHKFNGVSALKWMPNFFDGQEVVIQEKLHGSCCRAGLLRSEANTFWKKVLKFFHLLPKYEYVYGSNNVQLQERGKTYKGFYGENIYGAVLQKVDAFNKLKPGETIYGELIGEGVQANYTYGHKEHHFVLYDVKKEREDGSQEFLNPEETEAFAKERGFDFVPVLHRGVYDEKLAESLATGPSFYCPRQKVREGVVVKSRTNYGEFGHKKALKIINPVYLDDKTNSDNH